jgi:hypothetical protein
MSGKLVMSFSKKLKKDNQYIIERSKEGNGNSSAEPARSAEGASPDRYYEGVCSKGNT